MTVIGSTEHIGFDVVDGVAELTLRRPEKRNAISAAMWESILAHLGDASGRADVRVLVVSGSGGVFCAGADLASVRDADGTPSASFIALAVRAVSAIATFPVPSVARIEGPCIGAGCSIALACDVRFAHPNAVFAVPAVRYGIVYDEASIARLAALLGPSRAARLLYTAERLDAVGAASAGLVDECGENLDGLVTDFVDAVKLGDRSTIVATRRLFRGSD